MTTQPRSVFTPSASRPRFSMFPTTPTAEIIRSAVIVCGLALVVLDASR